MAQKGLGKGLGALLGDFSAPTSEKNSPVRMIPLQKAEPNPEQPRRHFDPEELQNLADSIAEHGIIQPLTVREWGDGYQIIAGERRWRAARMANLAEIPVLVVDADEETAAKLALVENLQRQDLNPMEEALGYKKLMDDYGLTQEETARAVVKSRSAVANTLRLLALPQSLQEMVADSRLTPGHARAVMMLSTEKQMLSAAQKIVALELSVRQAEIMCKTLAKKDAPAPEKPVFHVDYIGECEKSLSRKLGRGVKIVCGKRKGRFELDFYGMDDLQVLLDLLERLPAKEKKK
ncbi:MAG: ParB/RepB/Spo0J family partition protein [Oscillospiraceae bacterium]|nr:ParB/RepB/Spo0J family partition protein [Oscillospiraceae bacterium]